MLIIVLSGYCSVLPWWKPGFLRRFVPYYDGTSTSTSPDFDFLVSCLLLLPFGPTTIL